MAMPILHEVMKYFLICLRHLWVPLGLQYCGFLQALQGVVKHFISIVCANVFYHKTKVWTDR